MLMQNEKTDMVIAVLTGSLFVLLFGTFSFAILFSYLKQKRKFAIERRMRESAYKQHSLEAQLEMQEHVFRSISQEIHDNVGQILSLIKLNLNILSFDYKENEQFNNIKMLVTSAIAELRDLGTTYHADRLVEKGLVLAIRHQLEQLQKTGLFTTRFHSSIDNIVADKSKIVFLYRIVQEALNNIIKHSGADTVTIHIFSKDDEVHIVIKDNGKGFEKSHPGFKPGIGLSSIEQRALMIHGKATINSKPGLGTIVTLVFK